MYHQEAMQLPGVQVGVVTGADDRGRPLVSINAHGVRGADVVWMPNPPVWSDCVGLRVVVGHVGGDGTSPVVLGLLDAPPVAEQARPADTPQASDDEAESSEVVMIEATATTPDILRIASNKELVIECGKSKIAMRADGRIEIRGGHLISRSSGPNKIKGGSVHIN